MKDPPKHYFEDKNYMEQREIDEQNIYDSIDQGNYIIIIKTYSKNL